MTHPRRPDRTELFASLALASAAVALVGAVAYGLRDHTESSADALGVDEEPPGGEAIDLDDGAVADPGASAADVVAAASEVMGDVESVEFRLRRTGAPVFIDEFEKLALDALIGRFSVPGRAQASLTVTVEGNLATELGAVAIDEEVWLSNPVTGDFETLPDGFDIDPSRFFDPEGGWQPLLAGLYDVELVGIDDRGGERYHIRATGPAEEVSNITVGLVRDQEVPVELWIHPGTSLVTAVEFTTVIDGDESQWTLELGRYGERFTITPPENVRG